MNTPRLSAIVSPPTTTRTRFGLGSRYTAIPGAGGSKLNSPAGCLPNGPVPYINPMHPGYQPVRMCSVVRLLTRIAAPLAVIAAAAGAGAGAAASGAQRAHRVLAAATGCHSHLRVIAHGQGSPDDMVWDGHKLLAGDFHRGTVAVIAHGHAQ